MNVLDWLANQHLAISPTSICLPFNSATSCRHLPLVVLFSQHTFQFFRRGDRDLKYRIQCDGTFYLHRRFQCRGDELVRVMYACPDNGATHPQETILPLLTFRKMNSLHDPFLTKRAYLLRLPVSAGWSVTYLKLGPEICGLNVVSVAAETHEGIAVLDNDLFRDTIRKWVRR